MPEPTVHPTLQRAPTDRLDADPGAPYVAFEEFRDGWRAGRFHIVVDPVHAPRYVAHRTHATPIAIAIVGPGIALALAGWPVLGGALVALGIVLRRAIRWQAGPILLQMAAHQRAVYLDATSRGVIEVQRVEPASD